MRRTYKGKIKTLPKNGIFVFGSNTEGRHGKGAAKIAKDKFGAIYGQKFGLQGQSFAIVTKNLQKTKHPSVSKLYITSQILFLYLYAEQNKDKDFYVAYSGEGANLNGYTPKEMAHMFVMSDVKIPENIIFEQNFLKLGEKG
jgi:hypothetical protein